MSKDSIQELINAEARKLAETMLTPVDESKEPLRIIMNNDRGLCIVGNVDLSGDGEFVTIKNGRCVIRWGTSKHLAELAGRGPLPTTSLGYEYDHVIPRSTIALVLSCNPENWS